jgi:hypothetical protein
MTVRAGKYSRKYSDEDLKRIVRGIPAKKEAVESIKRLLAEEEQREAQELQESIGLLTEIASRSGDSNETDCFVYGGPVVLEEREYVRAFLELVNKQTADDTDELLMGFLIWIAASNSPNADSLRPWVSGQWVRIFRGADVGTKLSPLVEASCHGVVDGRVAHVPIMTDAGYVQRTVVSSGRVAQHYALLLIADPKRCYLTQLRRCKLESCRRFFLDDKVRPGVRRRYCTLVCGRLGDKVEARIRAKQWREQQKRTKQRRRATREGRVQVSLLANGRINDCKRLR